MRKDLSGDTTMRRRSFGFGIAFIIAGCFLPTAALPQSMSYEWGWGMHPNSWGIWGVVMLLVINMVFWIPVMVAIFLGIRWLMEHGKKTTADSAMIILRERYARGEINKEEFEAKKRDLV